MEIKRKPLQGVTNIVRFNWHFYLIAGIVLGSLIVFKSVLPSPVQTPIVWFSILTLFAIIVSLVISFLVYDISDLYQIKWLENVGQKKVLNINAGFDETSAVIQNKFPKCDLVVCDFYDPKKHTEVSIKRARKAYPPFQNTIQTTTNELPFPDKSFDCSVAILSAHEIRDEQERILFFKEIHRVTNDSGEIFVTEHLRDWKNFMAYTIGFLHFHSRSSWLNTFEQANLVVKREVKTTPFITTFILEKNGNTL
jgi:ubiquinone/menaquinone biosynthesis C-methylase UbiE